MAGLMLAGCSGTDGSRGSSDDESGPLAEFFGWDEEVSAGDNEFTEEERQQHYEVEELVVTCMEEQGFEYFPEPFWGDRDEVREQEDPFEEVWQLQRDDPEAFAKQYGYGATTLDYSSVETEPEEFDPSDDPNWEYRDSLSEAAQLEYEKALWGDTQELEIAEEGDDAVEVAPGELGGCKNEAYDEVYGGRGMEEEPDRFEDLWEEMETLYERVQDDPRVADAKRAWSDCMADAGYPDLEDIFDAQNLVYERQGELYGWNVEPEEPPTFDSEEEEREYWESYQPPEPDPAEVEELQQFELEVAWADFTCKQEHDVEQVEREVRFTLEEEFLESHRELLEEYRDWVDEQGVRG